MDAIAELFPTVITESRSDDGTVTRAIDFDLLRQELSDHIVDGPRERYQLDWPGKRAAAFAANAPIAKTLRPMREDSVHFDATKNIFIEGDNLEALKVLQESYLGKVKLIYIDPPYNTGQDRFVYPDDYSMGLDEYLERSGEISNAGERLVSNPEANGRFHSDWLTMMYPRLKLARNLLAADGLIFISIDANEVHNLIKMCDEVFGPGCHKNTIAVRRGIKNVQAQFDSVSALSQGHEYLLLYARNESVRLPKLSLAHQEMKPGKWDTFWRGTDRPTMRYELFGSTPASGQWRWEEVRTREAVQNYQTYLDQQSENMALDDYYLETLFATNDKLNFVRQNDDGVVQYYVPPSEGKLLSDNWMDLTLSGNATVEFDTEKSITILSRIVGWVTQGSDVVMDFFAGSGTTGHAVYAANASDGGQRSFVLVQLAEPMAGAERPSIASVTRERLRKAGESHATVGQDSGFRVFRVDTTNLADVFGTAGDLAQSALSSAVGSVKADRSDDDVLFEVLLAWGLAPSLPISREWLGSSELLSVDEDALIACFAEDVSHPVLREMAKRHPLRAVFKDSGFADDAARINAEQVFRELSPETEVRTI